MLNRVMSLVHLDFAPNHEQPQAGRVVLATVVSLVGSLLADAVLVVIAQALIPSTKGYAHFQFGDYAKLTVIGVLIACAAWPVTTRITSRPRWMFFRMAVPVLFVMHLAIAVVTYNALVRLAPVRARVHRPRHAQPVTR